MSDNPPGWYKDPAEPTTQRYWDGDGWLGDPLPIDATPPDGPPPGAQPAVPARESPPFGQVPSGWTPHPVATPPGSTPPSGGHQPGPQQPGPQHPGPQHPGPQHPGAWPPGAWPPGAWPGPGQQAPGAPPAGGFPPGRFPPGFPAPGGGRSGYAPGTIPPGALPPGWVPGVAYRSGPYVYMTAPRPHGLALAPLGRRLVARLIDIAAVAAISALLTFYLIHQWLVETRPFWVGVWRTFQAAGNGEPASSIDAPSMTGRGQWLQLGILFLVMLIWLAYEVPFIANYGQTLGKRVMGIKVMRLESTERVGTGRALRRWNSLGIAVLLWQCGVGFVLQFIDCLSPVWNRPLHLAIHDRAAATIVVRVGSELLAGTPAPVPAAVGRPVPGDDDWRRPPDDSSGDPRDPGGAT